MPDPLSPIGVFDSGVGGLTVLAALRERLPNERFLYLGDTARLPYGSKSPDTVRRYARQAAGKLVERGVKLLVIACNTASAVAVDDLAQAFAPLPVIGVVEPGAAAACAATRSGHVLITGTEGTVSGGAYQRAMLARRPNLKIDAVACPMFVALAEEGWIDGPIPEAVARRYLELELAGPERTRVDTVVLGCTHFPVLRSVLERVCGPTVTFVDSAQTTAAVVADVLTRQRLASSTPDPSNPVQLLATDAPARFARVGSVFLGHPLTPTEVELLDL
ncbi:glutamate racemase [Enhygromyxa salina]|uniref:Glutamate racemase n=1 Tax=Enhygromyxa salina TaxID=215803 RepID=A0A2S9YIS3_9BACT|nr:glutamate racemase [Enhygromyxa salina]PRQ04926.1 Glutamate racemase 1 [Enhygromyxa salina]